MANISRFDTAWLVSDGSNGHDSPVVPVPTAVSKLDSISALHFASINLVGDRV